MTTNEILQKYLEELHSSAFINVPKFVITDYVFNGQVINAIGTRNGLPVNYNIPLVKFLTFIYNSNTNKTMITNPIKLINKSNNSAPAYETVHSSGMDLKAFTDENIVLLPGERRLIHTGIYIELPENLEAQIRPRSGLAIKHGITVLNTPGTIDADYRGEICVILMNFGANSFEIKNGDRIAQMVICGNLFKAEWQLVSELGETARGEGGFGHTGSH